MEALKKKRSVLWLSLQRLKSSISPYVSKNEASFEYMAKLEAYSKKLNDEAEKLYDASNDVILKLKDDSDEDQVLLEEILKNKDDIIDFVVDVESKIAWFKSALDKERAQEAILNDNGSNSGNTGIRYATIMKEVEPPKFDGDATKFQEWRSMFENLVHENVDYNSTTKLYFLKKCLIGNASDIINHYPITREGYSKAWSHVITRYSKPRAVLGCFFKKLMSLEPIKNEHGIQTLLDTTNSVIRGLESVGEEVNDTMSRFLAYLICSKLDENTKRDWENFYTNMDFYPKFKDLDKFLQSRAHVAAERVMEKKEKNSSIVKKDKKSFVTATSSSISSKKFTCCECQGEHGLYACPTFLAKSPRDRQQFCKSKNLCLICLRTGHMSSACQHGNFRCRCGGSHNYLLHFGTPVNSSSSSLPKKPENPTETKAVEKDGSSSSVQEKSSTTKGSYSCVVNSISENIDKTVLLPSAVVKFMCGDIVGKMRVLLDSCSQANLISDSFIKKHNLPIKNSLIASSIKGVGFSSTKTSSIVDLIIASKKDTFRLEVQADVVPAAAMNYSVHVELSRKALNSLRNIPLADPAYFDTNVSIEKIDLILGAEYFGKCMCDQSLKIESLDLRLSQFGWIISGVAPQKSMEEKFVGFTRQTIADDLQKFWEIEEVEVVKKPKSLENEQCVKHFEETYSIGDDGKFIVRLPFKKDPKTVATNRSRALNALHRVEKNLDEKSRALYCEFMLEYEKMGHMSIAKHDPNSCFLPHRAVIRECSTTTPQRTVFNASAGSPSLNDCLMTGPTIQRDLFDILVSMRWFKFLFTADIAKMYRMIWVHPEDRKYQVIFWRYFIDQIIKEYTLNTVTYGEAPASFIATKCLDVIASELEKLGTPLAKLVAKLIRENFYMDDFNGGANTLEELFKIQKLLHKVLERRGFVLRKYSSNSNKLLENIDPSLLASDTTKSMTENLSTVAVLGLTWQPQGDFYSIKVNTDAFDTSMIVTKRIILSFISRTFDPLGLAAPVLIRGKLLLQTVWIEGKGWDDPVSQKTAELFILYIQDLATLTSIKIPRYIFGEFDCEIIGFCDASESAYCSVVYVRAKDERNQIFCRLISCKTRVAPTKKLTIPKLELQAALLLVDLLLRIANNLKISREKISAFSDSTVVLCWLSKPAEEWKTFVSNRVAKINSALPFHQWSYVKSAENPADDGTRGLEVRDFAKNIRWFEGPGFIREKNFRTYNTIPNFDTHNALEHRKIKASFNVEVVYDFTLRFSSYLQLIRSIAFILRLKCYVAKNKTTDTKIVKSIQEVPPLTKVEVEESFRKIVILVQNVSFSVDIQRLKNGQPVKKKSPIISLDPYLDEDGVLRVGGRLSRSSLSNQAKHPIIISSKCHFAKLFCRYVHEKYFHAQRKFIASFIASRFWMVGGTTNLIKFVIRTCVTCVRMRAATAQQIMGQLPPQRVTIAPPFTYVGVDFAGPFSCKCTDHRSTKYNQIYAAVFVCLTVRAIHIEIVSGLSTEKFLCAFQTFVARRGLPAIVFSDNGTNFVGTKSLLQLDEKKLTNYATKESFEWRFIPPVSPHQGGIWEAAVRSFKHHLTAVTKNQALNIEEYRTLFAKIEGVLNSRPLCYRSPIEQGCEILTPGHFLVGRSLLNVPKVDNEEISLSRRLLLLQNIFQGFWTVWSKDYLTQMQQRNKWKTKSPNVIAGQVVFVRNSQTKPFQWPIAIVESVYPDKEKNVRVVDVRYNGKIFRRNINSLIPLPTE